MHPPRQLSHAEIILDLSKIEALPILDSTQMDDLSQLLEQLHALWSPCTGQLLICFVATSPAPHRKHHWLNTLKRAIKSEHTDQTKKVCQNAERILTEHAEHFKPFHSTWFKSMKTKIDAFTPNQTARLNRYQEGLKHQAYGALSALEKRLKSFQEYAKHRHILGIKVSPTSSPNQPPPPMLRVPLPRTLIGALVGAASCFTLTMLTFALVHGFDLKQWLLWLPQLSLPAVIALLVGVVCSVTGAGAGIGWVSTHYALTAKTLTPQQTTHTHSSSKTSSHCNASNTLLSSTSSH